jgi:hypothetical protein
MTRGRVRDMTLTEFLLARIAEDEEPTFELVPYECDPGCCAPAGWVGHRCLICETPAEYGGTVAAITDVACEHEERVHRRSRALAECEAKRRIVERYATCIAENERNTADLAAFEAAGGSEFDEPDPALYTPIDTTRSTSPFETAGLAFACQSLSAAYADHPDYDPDWRP